MTFKINYNTHLTILKNNKSKNYLVTLAIGSKYFDEWKKYCSNSWIKYCAELIVLNSYFLPFPGTLQGCDITWKCKNFFKDKNLKG